MDIYYAKYATHLTTLHLTPCGANSVKKGQNFR